jgi:glycerate kinase
MRVTVSLDKFRGSLSAFAACAAVAAGLSDVGVTDIVTIPMADGGEGTLEVILASTPGTEIAVDSVDALGRPIRTTWALLADGTAVVEAANIIGLEMLAGLRDPLGASSAGLGRVLASVLHAEPARVLVALGGVASTDGGIGCLEEVGWDLRGVDTIVATDVMTTFVDAARVFAPQKGADPAQVLRLTRRLERLADRLERETEFERDLPGSGAAGGVAGGLAAIGARLGKGFDLVSEVVHLRDALDNSDLVVTGEGRVDETSLQGKVVGGVLDLIRGRPALVIAGDADPAVARLLTARGVVVQTLRARAADEDDSIRRAPALLRSAAADFGAELIRSVGYAPRVDCDEAS